VKSSPPWPTCNAAGAYQRRDYPRLLLERQQSLLIRGLLRQAPEISSESGSKCWYRQYGSKHQG
jgi:hypothetical protein